MTEGIQKEQKKSGRLLEPQLDYRVEVTDKSGRVIQREEGPSRSYVRQWNELVHVQAAWVYLGQGPFVEGLPAVPGGDWTVYNAGTDRALPDTGQDPAVL